MDILYFYHFRLSTAMHIFTVGRLPLASHRCSVNYSRESRGATCLTALVCHFHLIHIVLPLSDSLKFIPSTQARTGGRVRVLR